MPGRPFCSRLTAEFGIPKKRGREVQNTAHPRSYVSALSGGESIGGDEV